MIDVSKCKFFLIQGDRGLCECFKGSDFGIIRDCKEVPTCYYKQLQALKQENEELMTNFIGYKASYKLALSQRDEALTKLKKINQLCNEAPMLDSEFSMRVMEIIEGKIDEVLNV